VRINRFFYAIVFCAFTSCASTATQSGSHSADSGPAFAETVNAQNFYKGNLHVHTAKSDGDASPEQTLNWYKKHGYSFVALTDHNMLTVAGKDDKNFITLNGVEITGVSFNNAPIHVNAICGTRSLVGVRDTTKTAAQVLAEEVAISRKDGAVTLVNHPNFGWALSMEDVLSVDGFQLLEIASGHPQVHDEGNSEHPSAEEIWDAYMTKKHRIFSAAVDDAHDFLHEGEKRFPGVAYIQAWAPELTKDAICIALARGHFYSSKGAKITALVVEPRSIQLGVDHWQPATDHVDFIGAGGQLLARVTTMPARYDLRGGEGYVRAHVVQGSADHTTQNEAWTQAYFLKHD
jgi:hypothetical protein